MKVETEIKVKLIGAHVMPDYTIDGRHLWSAPMVDLSITLDSADGQTRRWKVSAGPPMEAQVFAFERLILIELLCDRRHRNRIPSLVHTWRHVIALNGVLLD